MMKDYHNLCARVKKPKEAPKEYAWLTPTIQQSYLGKSDKPPHRVIKVHYQAR
jgi:hypothetical protein